MKKMFAMLPGPAPVRVVLGAAIIVVALALMLVLFEYAGRYFDQGGTLG